MIKSRKILVAPSILNADFMNIGDEIKRLENGGADMIHCDVMDGTFVQNISFGTRMIEDIKKITNLPLDVHLMVKNPERHVDAFIDAGADYLVLHYESTSALVQTLEHIKARGVKCGVAINPDTEVEELKSIIKLCDLVLIMSVFPGLGGQKFIASSVDRLKRLKALRDELSPSTLIEMDGGINVERAKLLTREGLDIIVSGSALINASDVETTISQMKIID